MRMFRIRNLPALLVLLVAVTLVFPGCALFDSQTAPPEVRQAVSSQHAAIAVATAHVKAGTWGVDELLAILQADQVAWAALDLYFNGEPDAVDPAE